MIIHNPILTGSISLNGSDLSTITGSVATSASFDARTTYLESTSSILTAASASLSVTSGSLVAASASLSAASGSFNTRVTALEATGSALTSSLTTVSSSGYATSASLSAASASFNSRTTNLETYTTNWTAVSASFARTGSNNFRAPQYVSDTTVPTGFSNTTASIYTDGGLQVTKDSYFSGSMYIKGNLTIYGTQSIAYITSSQLNIATNLITVNTATPSIRFGGIAVQDSGSATGLTGSLLWDSQNNNWLYDNPSGSGNYDSAMVIMGPRNSSALGNEQGLSCNYLVLGHGSHHTTSSMIYHDGTNTCIGTGVTFTSAGAACFSSCITANASSTVNSAYPQLVLNNPTAGAGIELHFKDNGTLKSKIGTLDDINSWQIYNGGAIRFTVNNSGNVGIGNTTPDRKFYVADTSATQSTILGYNQCTTFTGTVIEAITDRTSSSAFNLMNLKSSTTSMFLVRGDGLACFAGQVCIGSSLVIAGSGGSSGILLPSTSNILGLVAGTSYSENVPRIEISGVAFDSCSSAANNVYIRANTVRFTLANASCETMRITSAGNVGIGASTPQQILSVNNPFSSLNALYPIIISQTGNAEIGGMYSTADSITNPIGAGLAFKTYQVNVGLTEKIRITHAGYMGIGCTAPSGKLQVVNSSTQYAVYTLGGNLELYTPEGNCGYVRLGSAYNLNGVYGSCGLNYITSGTSNHIFYTTDSACERMRITSTGIATFTCQVCVSVVRSNGTHSTAMILQDNVTGVQTPGFGLRLTYQSNGTGVQSSIGLENGGTGTNNESQISFYTQNTAGGLGKRLLLTSGGDACFAYQVCAPMFISTAGCVVSNSVITYSVGGTMAGYTATYFDFPTWNDNSQGQIFEIKAFFEHYLDWGYGTSLYKYMATRSTGNTDVTFLNCVTGNGGCWIAYKTSDTNLRICKIAGSYAGGGAYWIQVTAKQP